MVISRSQQCSRLVPIVAALLSVACGEGGGRGGSAASVSEGTITGFGSVIVNGQRWTTDGSAFEIDGASGAQSDLAVGMVVRVEGLRSGGSARADRVIFESRVRGPIRRIDVLGPDTVALHVLGVRALVSRAGTRFRDVSFSGLAADTVVELSGMVNPAGELEVTFLRLRGRPVIGLTEVRTFGVVSGLAGGGFMLGTAEVQFDSSTVTDDLGSAGVRNGLEVRVEGVLLANDLIDATEIEGPRGRDDDDFDEFEIEGIVSEFRSRADFRVAGRPVDASRARFEPNDPDLLREGVRVEVEGRFDTSGVLLVEKLKFRSNRVRIHAEVAANVDVAPASGRLFLLGVPIDVDSGTRLRDQRDDLSNFDLRDVRAGDFLEVRGLARADGTVMATRLEREETDDVELRGPVDMVDPIATEFTILGVPIDTDSATRFRALDGTAISESEFYARLQPGAVVEAEDREDGDQAEFDFADEAEFED